MEKQKLTKREYFYQAYYHQFKNIETGEIKNEEITKEKYESLGIVDGWKNNPVPEEGWQYVLSFGDTPKVDSPTGFLEVGNFAINGDEYLTYYTTENGAEIFETFSKEDFEKKFIENI